MNEIQPKYLKILLACVVVFLITVPLDTNAAVSSTQSTTDLEGFTVAIWNGAGVLDNSAIALEHMFAWMNATVIETNASHIFDGGLESVDILVFPGGNTGSYTASLGSSGMKIVRSWVSRGGSYFGICGGSLFGTRLRLEFFNGSYVGPVAGSGTYMMNMNVNRESTGPDLSDEPESYNILYWNSAYFSASNMTGIIPIVTYPSNGRAAMIAFHYDFGTVFLSSPHPEYEENDERDGTDDFDNLEDEDSEWGLLLKVSRWLVDESPVCCPIDTTTQTVTTTLTNTTTNQTGAELLSAPMIFSLAGAVGVVMVVLVVVIRRR
ncbi:MAG: BPL-N domain-containing protein [Candidatus Thorarchaeota archaeon]